MMDGVGLALPDVSVLVKLQNLKPCPTDVIFTEHLSGTEWIVQK